MTTPGYPPLAQEQADAVWALLAREIETNPAFRAALVAEMERQGQGAAA